MTLDIFSESSAPYLLDETNNSYYHTRLMGGLNERMYRNPGPGPGT